MQIINSQISNLIKELKQSIFEPLVKLGKTLYQWREEIARMWRFTKSNGITEGFHRKMKLFQLQEVVGIPEPLAYGYTCQATLFTSSVEKGEHWPPKLALLLPLLIPEPSAIGKLNFDSLRCWSIEGYLIQSDL